MEASDPVRGAGEGGPVSDAPVVPSTVPGAREGDGKGCPCLLKGPTPQAGPSHSFVPPFLSVAWGQANWMPLFPAAREDRARSCDVKQNLKVGGRPQAGHSHGAVTSEVVTGMVHGPLGSRSKAMGSLRPVP